MRSIFVKILLWVSVTLVVCLAGLTTSYRFHNRFAPGRHDFLSRTVSFQLTEARHAYETGGKAALRSYFIRLEKYYPGTHALVDEKGIDLLTGADRRKESSQVGQHWSDGSDRMLIAWPSRDGKYTFLVNAPSPVGPWSPITYYLWVVAAAVLCCWILTVQLGSPVRKLEQTVERFGRGDLQVRAATNRRDEFGKLARAFNIMADRTETLLKAERRLLQDVSHELRSPLARLEFAVELARTSSDRGASLDRIKKEVERLSTLVSELLQVTRAENDPSGRVTEEILLSDLLRDVVEDSGVESEAHNCELRLTASAPVQVRGDRELLRRAIENVLRNAIRYAPEQSSVEIGLRKQADKAVISIRDYGRGAPEESLPSLFKPFFRVEADRNRNEGGGVGLGLSIAERAVSVHQGTIRAQNASPGLQVEIELPLASSVIDEGDVVPAQHISR